LMAELPLLRMVTVPRPDTAMQERRAIQLATGDIVAFIDDDAIAPEDWLARLIAHYDDSRVGGVGGPDILVWNGAEIRQYADTVGRFTWFGDAIGNHHCITPHIRQVEFLKGCNMSFRRQAMGALDPKLAGSYGWEEDLACRVRKHDLTVIFDPTIQVLHFSRSQEAQQKLALTPSFLYAYTRNRTIVTFAHLGVGRSLVYLFWASLVPGRTWGFVGAVRKVVLRHAFPRQATLLWLAAMVGRLMAIKAIVVGRLPHE
jgi:GT2 family glycosyltransferase